MEQSPKSQQLQQAKFIHKVQKQINHNQGANETNWGKILHE